MHQTMKTHRRPPLTLCLALVLLQSLSAQLGAATGDTPNVVVSANNPAPDRLPTLGVWLDRASTPGRSLPMVSAMFPNVPGLVCDSWCYESELGFLGANALEGGKLELRHRAHAQPEVVLVTTVIPEPAAVEFLSRAELDRERGEKLPANLPSLNLCWQLRRAPAFKSRPEPYPEFVKRCFIFTERGRTFLHETARRPIPVRPLEHEYNNPPWVQMYVGTWQEIPKVGTNSWADYSPDRYVTRVIGTVSRDGRFLAALATDSATTMCQAWHDCLHNNPQWQPADAPPGQRRWRLKVYAMDNDPAALRRRVDADFPAGRQAAATAQSAWFQTPGVRDRLPVFADRLADRMTYSLSWLSGNFTNFQEWRAVARTKIMDCLLAPPPDAPFAPQVIAEQDRGTYVARKVVFNVTGDSRVLALMLVPKSAGPHAAVLLLHDHGAKFDIGKEKVIASWDETPEKLESARKWVEQYYGGRFLGDELARHGYVCLATDLVNWSDRGGGGYEEQQSLAANFLQLGASWAGLIAYEDMRTAEFLASRPEVDAKRVAAMGLSLGGFRTWQLAALSDRIAAGVSVCWMATRKGLMVPKQNQTVGQSAFSMTHPGLAAYLDYPDVASVACPKPMMFICGNRDHLFPVGSIEEAFDKMRKVWTSQHSAAALELRLYDAPHEFSLTMQDEAFAWLDKVLEHRRQ